MLDADSTTNEFVDGGGRVEALVDQLDEAFIQFVDAVNQFVADLPDIELFNSDFGEASPPWAPFYQNVPPAVDRPP